MFPWANNSRSRNDATDTPVRVFIAALLEKLKMK